MTKSKEGVVVNHTGAIATITFASPKANALSQNLLLDLSNAITETSANKSLKVIVLQSSGNGAFCAGASFDEMKNISTLLDAKNFFMGFGKVMLAIVRSPIPVIAAVHGKAVGGALGLISACDYAVASSNAAVKLSELSIGIGPYVISNSVIRKIGLAKFSELTLGLQWRDAQWAATAGLYSELVDHSADVQNAALSQAKVLEAVSRQALVAAKNMLSEGTLAWENELEELASRSAELLIAQKH